MLLSPAWVLRIQCHRADDAGAGQGELCSSLLLTCSIALVVTPHARRMRVSPKEINSRGVMCRGSSPLEKGDEQHWCLLHSSLLSVRPGGTFLYVHHRNRPSIFLHKELWACRWAVRWEASAPKGMQILEPLLLVGGFTGPSVKAKGKGCFAPW